MDVRSAITRWAGSGATRNARASLDEWNRAQEEVAALLMRLDHPERAADPPPPAPAPRPDRREPVAPGGPPAHLNGDDRPFRSAS